MFADRSISHLTPQAPAKAVMHQVLIGRLYDETISLADDFNRYIHDHAAMDQDAAPLIDHVRRCCELQKVTARLVNCLSWLITQRMVISGEIPAREAIAPSRRLGAAPSGEPGNLIGLPALALTLIMASEDLYRRIGALDAAQAGPRREASPVHDLLDRLT